MKWRNGIWNMNKIETSETKGAALFNFVCSRMRRVDKFPKHRKLQASFVASFGRKSSNPLGTFPVARKRNARRVIIVLSTSEIDSHVQKRGGEKKKSEGTPGIRIYVSSFSVSFPSFPRRISATIATPC